MKLENSTLTIIKESKQYKLLKKKCCERERVAKKISYMVMGQEKNTAHNDPRKKIPFQR
jgi:hypothetical protein